MSFKVSCAACLRRLSEPGGLFFSSPMPGDVVRKLHLCKVCAKLTERAIRRQGANTERKILGV